MSSEPITTEWLANSGWHQLPQFERQPAASWRRCLGCEEIGEKFMRANEDACIDVAESTGGKWFVWITRASAQNNHASVWVSCRMMTHTAELVLLYEALTGRRFGPPKWYQSELGKPLFGAPEQ